MPDPATVAVADIAQLAGVGRAAVSNWRRRFDDFPAPVGGTSTSPLFSLEDVEEWLRRRGKLAEVPLFERVWQQLRAGVEHSRLAEAAGHIGAFLLFLDRSKERWEQLARRMEGRISSAEFTATDLPEMPETTFDLSLLRDVAELAEQRGPAEAFDLIHARYLEASSKRVPTLPAEVAGLMADLLVPQGGTVLDPACGRGSLLLSAASAGATGLFGQERNATAARMTAVRLLLHGHEAVVRDGDSLRADRFGFLEADAAVCSPPFGERSWGFEELAGDIRWQYGLPPRGEPELAWVQHALFHVKPGGHIAILMPAAAAGRRSGRRIRAQLLRSGALRAVVALPAGAAPHTLGSPHLWVLRRPAAGDPVPSRILMMDVTELPWARLRQTVTERWRGFRSSSVSGSLSDRMVGPPDEENGAVPLIRLLDEDVDLTPVRHVAVPSSGGAAQEFMTSLDAVASAVAALQRVLGDLRAITAGEDRDLPRTTLAEQAKAGAIGLHEAHRTASVPGRIPLLTLEDVIAGRAPSGRTSVTAGMVIVEPGDVVFPAGGRKFAARVVREGGAVLGSGLLLLRVDPDRVDPVCLAGFLRIAGEQAAERGEPSRADIRRVEIPRLPLEEQRRLGNAFQKLELLENEVAQVGEQGARLVRLGLGGLSGGALSS
ncbi:N-6 DNA methylase [Microbispora sp. H13382]|uniref:N-6 DNA methylase n=1 Tax=Microbispora sp. H13382 TaxID=2729112 RepID=UPI001603E371|nr:N-6 DNA methylase [Microbispora sp. H13382]